MQARIVDAYLSGRPGILVYTAFLVSFKFCFLISTIHLLGVEHNTAMPTRKSQARSLPLVAEAA